MEGPHRDAPVAEECGGLAYGTVAEIQITFGGWPRSRLLSWKSAHWTRSSAPARGVLPESRITDGIQPEFVNVHGVWIEVPQEPDEARREVLIEQEHHRSGTAISFRWMSAADGQRRTEVLSFEVRKVREDLSLGHSQAR